MVWFSLASAASKVLAGFRKRRVWMSSPNSAARNAMNVAPPL